MTDIRALIRHIDAYLEKEGKESIAPVEANEILEKAGILKDSKSRRGLPLRNLLRAGQLPHAFQLGGKGSRWVIPHSKKKYNR